MICAACDQEIAEGQHYLKTRVEFTTHMPDSFVPVVEVEPTVINAVVCTPRCLTLWTIDLHKNPLIEDVFAR